MKQVAVITGTRADFGLLRPLMVKLDQSPKFNLQVVATAMHLSPEFGLTVNEISQSGFKVAKKVECLLSSDTAAGITKSVGLAMIGFADSFEDLKPNLVVILGDRTEMLAAATAAMIANIPIIHIHGGETTEGAYDEGIRHAITKLSYWHFASTAAYRNRIIQLGEDPKRVFNVGAIGLDSIKGLKLLKREAFENSINFNLSKRNILITFHPVTLENETAEYQFSQILAALKKLSQTHFIFTHANSDKNGRIINRMIENFVSKNPSISTSFKSMGQLRYLSALQYVDVVLGNSSSGIIEVPSFDIPTINIGDRQKGRVMSESVINVAADENKISQSLALAFSDELRARIKKQQKLYGNGTTAEQIIDYLNEFSFDDLKKPFYDLN